jgi:polyferredoxin
MGKLHNHRYPPGLERELLRKIPKYLLGTILVPLFMVAFVRLSPIEELFASTAEEVVKLHTTIDFLSIAIFVAILPVILTLFIGCIIVMLMKGPAYIADSYEVNDADKPDDDDKNT